jgi:hypothetical protein
MPSFSGGALTDGTYYLTSLVIYPSDGGSPFYVTRWQQTVVISGNSYEVVQKIDDGDGDLGFDLYSSYTLVASGANLTLTPTCGTTAHSGPMPYTATNPDGGKATLYMEIDSGVVAYFTQQ